ncbi:hypothetical protein O6H91_03G033400 [Diphasiastrum complanatum]|uniref:Uncharacterized protein n=1 Tax=Diphasiastrum complanatum TaxID=34168 RepID=A0ACC2E578_DIPCM|nr:hypothetical protein O6H91_03G033400 [Diphasiastrum complanatum]
MTKSETVVLKVQLHCENCIRKVKKALAEIDGVESIGIDVEQKKVTVVGNIDSKKVLKKVQKTGKYVELLQSKDSKDASSKKKEEPAKKNDSEKKKDDSGKQAEEQGVQKDVLKNNKKDESKKNEAEGNKGKQETPVKKDESANKKDESSNNKDESSNNKEKPNMSYSYAQNDMTFMFSEDNPNNCSIM